MTPAVAIEARIRALLADVGATGWLHCVDLDDRTREVAVDADDQVVLASVFKLPLLVELYRQADSGALALTEQVEVGVQRTVGSTGLATMQDPARLSLRDLATLMITVSDVAAADVLLERVGREAVNAAMACLGLRRTRIRDSCAEMLGAVYEDLGVTGDNELARALAEPTAMRRLRVLDPRQTCAGTPRELTSLLTAIWRGGAASEGACASIRRLLGQQVWPHRLAAGFPSDAIRVSGKTGTLPAIRNEVGVVEYPDGRGYAVAVFTRSEGSGLALPQVDAAIGVAARIAVDDLRRQT